MTLPPTFPRSPRAQRLHTVQVWVYGVVMGTALLMTLNFTLYQPLPHGWIPVAFVLVVLLHELGHLLAGWSRGLTFHRLTLGPLEVTRTGLRWCRMHLLASVVMHCPARGSAVVDVQWTYAGAALLLGMGLLLDLLAQGWVTGDVQAFLKILAAIMMFDLVVNLWPSMTGSSDGAVLWRLRAGSPERASAGFLHRLLTTPEDRVPPGGWTPQQMALLTCPSRDPLTELNSASTLLGYRANLGLDVRAELARLTAVRASLPTSTTQAFTSMVLAFGWARSGEPARAARHWADGNTPAFRAAHPTLFERASLAVAVAQGQVDEVRRLVAEVQRSGRGADDLMWIDRLVAEAEAAGPAATLDGEPPLEPPVATGTLSGSPAPPDDC